MYLNSLRLHLQFYTRVYYCPTAKGAFRYEHLLLFNYWLFSKSSNNTVYNYISG